MKKCPYCAEQIQDEAIRCKHCAMMLNDTIGGMATMAPGGGTPSRPGTSGSAPPPEWGDTLDGMATLTPESLTAGQVLAGRYRLDSIIGAGGMGIVWRATDSELDQVVAVKVLPGVLSRNARAIESLKAEAKLSLKLTHSNICRLTNFHSDGNIKFLIMEYLDGQTLEALLASRPSKKLTLEQLRRIAQQIGQALDYAHSLSPPVLHRDIKPANIMIAPDGSAKLLDFGIAREIKDTMTQVTGKFDTAGTLPYMSPEQFRGSKMTTASDTYSLAAVLYECLAGKPYVSPHGDPSYQILQRPYDAIDDAPDEINAALNAALAKDHSQRTAKCAGILQASSVEPEAPLRTAGLQAEREAPSRAVRLQAERKALSHLQVEREVPGKSQEFLNSWTPGECIDTLKGHKKDVNSVSISLDGCRGISGSDDNMLKYWDLDIGKCIRTLKGHGNTVMSVSISPDGKHGFSGSLDSTLRYWDIATGQCIRTLKGHTGPVDSVSISPDGCHALSGSRDRTLKYWGLATGQCLRIFKDHANTVLSVSISADGRYGISGSRDNTLKYWCLATGQCLCTLKGHRGDVNSVSISPDGGHALSGSEDNTLKYWNLVTGECIRTLKGHTNWVWSVSISPDGRRALSGSRDKTLKYWDIATGQCLRTLKGHRGDVRSVSISPGGRGGLSGSYDKTLKNWDFGEPEDDE